MDYIAYNIETQIILLPLLLKIFPMLPMIFWYDKESLEENMVENISTRCRNCVKETGLSMKNINTNYKDIITKFVLNTMLHHVGM